MHGRVIIIIIIIIIVIIIIVFFKPLDTLFDQWSFLITEIRIIESKLKNTTEKLRKPFQRIWEIRE